MKENRQSLLVSWEKVLLLTWEWIVPVSYTHLLMGNTKTILHSCLLSVHPYGCFYMGTFQEQQLRMLSPGPACGTMVISCLFTHLDVYKRQILFTQIQTNAHSVKAKTDHETTHTLPFMPVSYTHLRSELAQSWSQIRFGTTY